MKIKDSKEREWIVQLNFKMLCRIEDEVGWKILENPMGIPASLRTWGEIAGVVMESQIKERGIDYDDFAEGWIGPTFQSLIDAFITELSVFFKGPNPGVAALLLKTLELQHQAGPLIEERIQEAFVQASSALQGQQDLSLGDILSGSSTT